MVQRKLPFLPMKWIFREPDNVLDFFLRKLVFDYLLFRSNAETFLKGLHFLSLKLFHNVTNKSINK